MSKLLKIPEKCGSLELIKNDYYDERMGYNEYRMYIPSMLCNNKTLNEYLLKHTNINQTNNDYIIYNGISIPFVIIFHGWTSNTHNIVTTYSQTNFEYLAEKYNMILIVPQALGDPDSDTDAISWNGQNCCDGAVTQHRQDVLFVENLVTDLSISIKMEYSFVNFDQYYIHLFGQSNGAFFVSKFTWLASIKGNDRLKYDITSGIGIAGYVFDNNEYIGGAYNPGSKQYIPIMQYHGLKDKTVNARGCGCKNAWNNSRYFGFSHDCCCGIVQHNHGMCVSLEDEFTRRIRWNECNIPNITEFYNDPNAYKISGFSRFKKKCYHLNKNGIYGCKANMVLCYLFDAHHPMINFEHFIDVNSFRNDIELFWRQSLCHKQNGTWDSNDNICKCNELQFNWTNVYYCFNTNISIDGESIKSFELINYIDIISNNAERIVLSISVIIVVILMFLRGYIKIFYDKQEISTKNAISNDIPSDSESDQINSQ